MEPTRSNSRQAVESSARRFVKLVELDAPDVVIENELRMLSERSARLRAEIRERLGMPPIGQA